MLQVSWVTKRFGDFTVINNIYFNVKSSSIYGLVGYNGAGKTTLLKVLAGIYKPEKGGAFLNGEPIYENPEAKSQLFFIPDEVYAPVGVTMKNMASFYKTYYPNFNEKLFKKLIGVTLYTLKLHYPYFEAVGIKGKENLNVFD